jgi:regulatory protein
MKKDMTEQEAYLQLAALCAQAEHCQQEMRDKMRRWELDESVQNRIIDRLIQERYVDDERYARAFVKDKIRYNKWGRRKVQQALWQKRIDADIQQRVLDEIDEKEYLDVLRPLLKQKRKSIRAANDYELNQKLARFALSRGFTFDLIRQCMDIEDDFEEIDDSLD